VAFIEARIKSIIDASVISIVETEEEEIASRELQMRMGLMNLKSVQNHELKNHLKYQLKHHLKYQVKH
jgi:hypothetical protein